MASGKAILYVGAQAVEAFDLRAAQLARPGPTLGAVRL
jgi:hypothetical protein